MNYEIWKPINGYEGRYLVSNYGRVKSLIGTPKFLKPAKTKDGYLRVLLFKNKKQKNWRVHRLVALHFKENPHNKPQINHKDGIKTNNNADNLEWATSSENHIHAHANGLKKSPMIGRFGSNHPISKAVQQILNGNIIAEYCSMREAEKETGILVSNISACCLGKQKLASGYEWKFIKK